MSIMNTKGPCLPLQLACKRSSSCLGSNLASHCFHCGESLCCRCSILGSTRSHAADAKVVLPVPGAPASLSSCTPVSKFTCRLVKLSCSCSSTVISSSTAASYPASAKYCPNSIKSLSCCMGMGPLRFSCAARVELGFLVVNMPPNFCISDCTTSSSLRQAGGGGAAGWGPLEHKRSAWPIDRPAAFKPSKLAARRWSSDTYSASQSFCRLASPISSATRFPRTLTMAEKTFCSSAGSC
mmetsp:Transcript_2693/g.5958  ORF Transcript_2693/g.5958 Transcript_2693/m.5958 type:complete len:239 (-) Transcript_2693:245-961(-)